MDGGKTDKIIAFEHQPRGVVVSIAPSLSAQEMVRSLVNREVSFWGGRQPAQRAVAARLRVSHHTIRALQAGRLKRVCVDFYARLHAEQARRLADDLVRAEHALHVARSIGLDPRSAEFCALEAAASAARKTLEGGQ